MSQKEVPRLTPEQRLEIIKRELPRGTNQEDIAKLCGCVRETISRDIRAWELSGGFEAWLRSEWRELFDDLRDEDTPLVFREVSKLVARTMTQRTEARVEGFTLRIWQPGDKDEDAEEPKDL